MDTSRPLAYASVVDNGEQLEMFLGGSHADGGEVSPLHDVEQEAASVWGLPIGSRVHVALREHAVPALHGTLRLAQLPRLPFRSADPLTLRIGNIEFTTRQIASWCLV